MQPLRVSQTIPSGTSRSPRLSRLEPARLPAFHLTERDRQIVRAVYECRALTSRQIETLFFAPPEEQGACNDAKPLNSRCKYRLQLLYQHGYLHRDEQPQKLSEGRRPLVYFLDRKGAQLLAELAGCEVEELDWDEEDHEVSFLFLEHLLYTNQVRLAATLAARKLGWSIPRWLDEKTLRSDQMKDYVLLKGPQGGERKAAVVPDAYFVLDSGGHLYHHFVEIDLRTVTGEASAWGRRDWARKVAVYLEYYRSGQYQERYHTGSLRILTVTTGERRLLNLKAITERAGGRSRFWFTTFELATAEQILTAPIWQVAGKEGPHTLTW